MRFTELLGHPIKYLVPTVCLPCVCGLNSCIKIFLCAFVHLRLLIIIIISTAYQPKGAASHAVSLSPSQPPRTNFIVIIPTCSVRCLWPSHVRLLSFH
jgi:hypothetical protein